MRSWSDLSSIRTSMTARSSSVADSLYLRVLDDPGNRDDLVATHDEGPGFPVGARDLGVDEHVLDLLPPAGEPVAGPPSSHFETRRAGGDAPRPPAHGSVEVDRPALEPEAVVLAHSLDPVAGAAARRAGRRREQLREGRRQCLSRVERVQDVLVGGGVELAQERQDAFA